MYEDEFYKIMGICMVAHQNLGRGFLEIIYKYAIEHELNQ